MTQHDRVRDAQLCKCGGEQVRLLFWNPKLPSWPSAIAKARPVKTDNPVMLRKNLNQTTQQEVLDHGPITMEQHHRHCSGFPPFNVMQPNALGFEEYANRPVSTLRYPREQDKANREQHQQDDDQH